MQPRLATQAHIRRGRTSDVGAHLNGKRRKLLQRVTQSRVDRRLIRKIPRWCSTSARKFGAAAEAPHSTSRLPKNGGLCSSKGTGRTIYTNGSGSW